MSIISNPFITGNKLLLPTDSSHIEINIENIPLHFKNVFVIVKTDDSELPMNFFVKMLNQKTLDEVKDKLVIWQTNLQLLKNKDIFEKLSIIKKEDLLPYNKFNFELDRYNIVVYILNVSFKNIINYLNNLEGTSTLDKLYNILIVSQYLKDDQNNIKNVIHVENLIKNLEESLYWSLPYNCLANLSKPFKNRKFNNIYKKKMLNDKKEEKEEKEEKENQHYLEYIFKTKNYVDASSVIQKSGYKYYYVNNICNYSKEDINSLFTILNPKNRYLLFCNLLVSKNYSHLVINNSYILEMMKDCIKDFSQLMRYIMSYTWLKMYFDESILKRKIKTSDSIVFDINTAEKLPLFPFSYENPKFNPYMPIMIDDKILNAKANINSFMQYKNKVSYTSSGFCNLEEFKKRINIFTLGNNKGNLFADIEWKKLKLALGGSIMSACLQKHHPLLNIFTENNMDAKLNRFFNEYYSLADIDLMFLGTDVLQYMQNVKEFYNQIVVNTCIIFSPYAEPEHIRLNQKFQAHYSVKDTWVIKNIVNENLTFEFIYKNLEEKQIKDLFKVYFESDLIKKLDDEFKEEKDKLKKDFPDYFQKADDYELKIHIIMTNKKENDELDLENEGIMNDLKCDTQIKINYKYQIHSPHLNHKLELFMSKGEDHMSLVSAFHLPCVRSYYDGDNVYILPSCIFAHMTYMNIDYKYFAGSKDPIEIINKNRMRGFGTWLNENEIKNFIEYSSEIDFWNNLYGVNKDSINKEEAIRGALTFKHKLLHPRLINIDYFYEAQYVNLDEGYNDEVNGETINSELDIISEINRNYGVDPIDFNMKKFTAINKEGFINPLQKWLIEAFYEMKK
jgi:hypothetical protein